MIGGNKRIFVFLPFLKNVLIIKDNAVTDIAKHKKKTNVKVGSECGSTLPCSLTFSDRSMVNIKQAMTR
jgi:hypothetical protein